MSLLPSQKFFRWPLVVFGYCLLVSLWFLPDAMSGARTFFAYGDAIEQSYPWMVRIALSLHEGFLPLWNPYSQGGTSFVGEIQSGVFYPVTLLFAWLFGSKGGITLLALELWVLTHFVIGLVGAHWLMRELGMSRTAAVIGAVVYVLLGPVLFRASSQVGIFFGLVWLPWAVAFAWRFYGGKSFWNAAGIGLIVGTQVNAGHIQPAFHAIVLIGSLGLFVWWQSSNRLQSFKRILLGALVAVVMLVIVAGPQLYLGIEYLKNVYRWYGADGAVTSWERIPLKAFLTLYLVTPTTLLSIVNPWQYSADDACSIFIGVPLLFLIVGMLWQQGLTPLNSTPLWPYRKWLIVMAVGGLLMSLGGYTLLPLIIYPLPLGTAVRSVGRYVILFHFVVAIMAAIVYDQYIRRGDFTAWVKRIPAWMLWLFFAHALAWSLYRASPMLDKVAIQFCIVAGLLLAVRYSRQHATNVARIFMVCAVFFSAWQVRDFAMPPMSVAKSPAPAKLEGGAVFARINAEAQPWRVIVDDSAGFPKNVAVVNGVQTKYGHSATYFKPYFDFISRDWNMDSQINDVLGVRWVVSRSAQPLREELFDPLTGLHLYERPSAFPRAWLASQQDDLLARKRILPTVTWGRQRAGLTELTVQIDKPDAIVFSDIFYPGWKAYVNDTEASVSGHDILGSKSFLKKVRLDRAGTHRLRLEYRPWSR